MQTLGPKVLHVAKYLVRGILAESCHSLVHNTFQPKRGGRGAIVENSGYLRAGRRVAHGIPLSVGIRTETKKKQR